MVDQKGYEIDFEIPHLDTAISVYTTRTDTLFGATYLALAPEHPIVQEIASLDNNVQEFLEDTKSQAVSEEALEKMEKKGVPLGFNAINPINGEDPSMDCKLCANDLWNGFNHVCACT